MSRGVEVRPPQVPTLIVGLGAAAAAAGLPEYCLRGAAWCGDLQIKRTARGSRWPYEPGAGRILVSVADLEAWLDDLDPEAPYMERWLSETASMERLDALAPASLRELLQPMVDPGVELGGTVSEIAWTARRSGVTWTAISGAIGVPRIPAMMYFGAAGRSR